MDEKIDYENRNSLPQLMEAFSCEGRKVSPAEFKNFWGSLSDEEKEYYKTAPLN